MRALSLALLLPALAAPAAAATLRPVTSLSAPVVKLCDLFDDAGTEAARVLGPAPPPGGRIVVEAPQLAAIARQFGVDWQPASPGDRAVLDRPGRPIAREAVLAVLTRALQDAGAPAGFELEVPDFATPLLPPDQHDKPVVEQLDYDPASGRFTALVVLAMDGAAPIRQRLSGRAEETALLPVASHRLLPGSVLRADDVRLAKVRAATVHAEMARQLADVIGMAVRVQTAAGQPLPLADLVRPPLVEKGAAITLALAAGGIVLTAQGRALEAGAEGDRVRVLNPLSRAIVEAVVTGPGSARVEPGSLPLLPAGGARVAAR